MRVRVVVLGLALTVGCGRTELATSPTTPPTATTTSILASTTTPRAPATTLAGPVRFASPYARMRSAKELAVDLADAEAIVYDGSNPAADRARAARRQQIRIRQLVDTTEWDAEVLAGMPPPRRETLRRNVEAGRLLLAMFKVFPADLPPWEIVEPAPAADLLHFYQEAQAALGVDWTYLAAINLVETRMGRIRGVSTSGARGPMQFQPPSWEMFGAGGNIEDNRDSIFAAARHLISSGGKPFDIDKALFGYNRSNKYVTAVKNYAAALQANPETYVAYHAWETFYRTQRGDHILPKGYKEASRIPMAEYAKRPVVTIEP